MARTVNTDTALGLQPRFSALCLHQFVLILREVSMPVMLIVQMGKQRLRACHLHMKDQP